MERLTEKLDGKSIIMLPSGVEHHWCIGTRKFGDMTLHYLSGDAADRLAAYEDTGLAPERVAELAQADQAGRLVVLPCKVGDTVYVPQRDGIHMAKVIGIRISASGKDTVLHLDIKAGEYRWGSDKGRTWFATRQEAEAAVEGKEVSDDA